MGGDFAIEPRGRFSLRESAEFGFGQRHARRFDGAMRLGYCSDDGFAPTGVLLTQDDDGRVHGVVEGGGSLDAAREQVARVLSLEHDSTSYDTLVERDAVLAPLAAAAPGLRPPLFHSPYEAAVWAVLAVRRPEAVAAALRARLSEAHGTVVEVGGEDLAVLPTPEQLLRVQSFDGVPHDRWERLHGIARAALDGELDNAVLRALGPEEAAVSVQRLKGIGPFYSSLIVIRCLGFTDVLVDREPRLAALLGEHYDLGGPASPEQVADIAEAWRPWRTWAAVLVRAASRRQ